MNQSLDEFIPVYPDLTKNDSQKVIFSLAEYKELQYYSSREDRLKKGEFFMHQISGSRFMRYQDRVFILDSPGTGKTCKLTLANELIKTNTNYYKRFIFVCMSGLMSSLKAQIICKCTNEKYINDVGSGSSKKRDINLSKKIPFSTSYTTLSYDNFFKNIKSKTVDQLNEEYGYSVINFDEITQIIKNSFSKIDIKNGNYTETIDKSILELFYIKDMNDPRIINSEVPYIQYWRFFHSVKTCKIIFASGTPYTNRSAEFLMLVNCLLPLNNQIDIDLYSKNVFTYNLKKYEKYFNGLFLFVEASSAVPLPRYHGVNVNLKYKIPYPDDDTSDFPTITEREIKSQLILYKTELFGYQNKLIFLNKDGINSGVNIKYDEMICYVDSNMKYGTEANKDMNTLANIRTPGISGLYYQMLSCGLYTEIARIEEERYQAAIAKGLPGPGYYFNYLFLVETAIGSLIQIFFSLGYEVLYLPEHFDFLKESQSDYCNISVVTFSGLVKKKRAVFLPGYIDANIREKVRQVAGSKANIHGEYIQFLDGSEVMGIGVNVANARGMLRPLGEWSEASKKQSEDRVFREDGSDYLREYEADEIEKKTGIRPDPLSIEMKIDVYNFCGFTRHFYLKYDSNYEQFKKSLEINSNQYVLESLRDQNGLTDNGILFNPISICHIVGFCDTGKLNLNIKSTYDLLLMNYCKISEIPHEKLSSKFGVEISTDLSHLGSTSKDIIVCNSGILFIRPQQDPEYLSFMTNKVLLYHNQCDFMKNYISNVYFNECSAIGSDGKMYPVHMLYLSSTERKYITMERKSFGTRRLFRHSKRFAVDCFGNHQRTFKSNTVDGTLECDYDVCEYTCASDVLDITTNKSDTAFLYEENEEFWNNYEVLYSDDLIKSCKNDIINMFKFDTEVMISDIFTKLLPKYKREYFINMAIYELISDRYKMLDRFGYTCYISAVNTKLFLRRDFPTTINPENKESKYIKRIIGVTNEPDYRVLNVRDNEIINEIESLSIDNNIIEYVVNTPAIPDNSQERLYFDNVLSTITRLIRKLNFASIKLLIERCFGRIGYNKIVMEQYKNPIYALKSCDRIICNIIFAIRCNEISHSSGLIFIHNQPEVKEHAKYNEIRHIKEPDSNIRSKDGKLKNVFWRLHFDNLGAPIWRPCKSEDELSFVTREIKNIIANEIIQKITIMLPNGQQYRSDFYLSYLNGTYRLTKQDNDGCDINSINETILNDFLFWLQTSPLVIFPDFNFYYSVIINSGKKIQRNNAIVNFFKAFNLIFYYNIPELDGI